MTLVRDGTPTVKTAVFSYRPDLPTARKLLGENAIIGVTVSATEEAQKACKDGADYLGVGTMFATAT